MPIGKQLTSQSQRELKKFFAQYGSKRACQDVTGIEDSTIARIVNSGRGVEDSFNRLSEYTGIKLEFKKSPFKVLN